MEGMAIIDTNRIIRWWKDSYNKWKIELIKEEENSASDGHTNLIKETVLKDMEHTDS